jgi:hypothetical protein
MTSETSQNAEAPTVQALPRVAAQLRRIALHEETAALLDIRAARAGTDAFASPLRRRAAEHRREAQRLRAELVAGTGYERRHPGKAIANSVPATP